MTISGPASPLSRLQGPAAPADSSASAPALGPAAEQHEKLVHGAREFEAMLLAHWWNTMEQSDPMAQDGQDPAFQTLQSTSLQAMTMAMARGGGIGLAKMLVQSLEAKPATQQTQGLARLSDSKP